MSTAKTGSAPQDQPLLFTDLGPRKVVADFSGGTLSSDGGALLLRQVYVQLSSTFPLQELFRLCQRRLMRLAPASG